jgi:hypothetical protein
MDIKMVGEIQQEMVFPFLGMQMMEQMFRTCSRERRSIESRSSLLHFRTEVGAKEAIMANSTTLLASDADHQWFIVGRWQEYEGESRANLLRIAGIGAFYFVELMNYYGLHLGFIEMPTQVDITFHRLVTGIALGWVAIALAIHLSLTQRFFPAALKYLSTACDLVFLTAILTISDGPRSPLLVGYFLIIVLATLRFSLSLVRYATVGSMAGYLILLGYMKWYSERDLNVPRYYELIFLLGLAITGVILGQVIRRIRYIAKDYAQRLDLRKGEST